MGNAHLPARSLALRSLRAVVIQLYGGGVDEFFSKCRKCRWQVGKEKKEFKRWFRHKTNRTCECVELTEFVRRFGKSSIRRVFSMRIFFWSNWSHGAVQRHKTWHVLKRQQGPQWHKALKKPGKTEKPEKRNQSVLVGARNQNVYNMFFSRHLKQALSST